MSAERAARYTTVQSLSDEIAHYLDGLAVSAYPESWVVRSGRWIGKKPSLVVVDCRLPGYAHRADSVAQIATAIRAVKGFAGNIE